MAWKIIEFNQLSTTGASCSGANTENKSVSVVPKTWLFEKEGRSYCWWPSKSNVNVTNLVRRMVDPQRDWEFWHVVHVYEETFYDYAQAREVLNNASEVTDLDDYIRALKEKAYGRGKRSPKRKYVRDEDVGRKARGLSSVLTPLPVFSSDEDEFDGVGDFSGGPQKRRSMQSDMAGSDFTQLMSKLDYYATIYTKTMDRMESNIKNLTTKVVALEETQKVILEKFNEGLHNLTKNQPQSASIQFQLPIRSWSQYCEMMEKVREKEGKEQLIKLLSQVGGKDLTAVANGILSKLICNKLAQNCSWKGQRGNKYSLERTPILSIVHGAVVHHLGMESTTEDKVKEKIQNWLKQASRREVKVPNIMEIYMEEEINRM